jgi:hypothetical protein
MHILQDFVRCTSTFNSSADASCKITHCLGFLFIDRLSIVNLSSSVTFVVCNPPPDVSDSAISFRLRAAASTTEKTMRGSFRVFDSLNVCVDELHFAFEGSVQYLALHCCLSIRPNSLGQDARCSARRGGPLSWIDIYMTPDSLHATLSRTARNNSLSSILATQP